eukprot:TRINITY_DN942_c0_g1_i10.p1 TRINITY_DN942_c0_g1~~TRINITY_DN942_c0_g1_i10.p1  ORF type:complete len:808 (+),score=232.68 TRINITY_DN942_c0_g1_i10:67-2490(+)
MLNVTKEHFSSELEPAKIGIIAASSAITGLALFSFLGLLFARKRVSARLAVCCVQWLIVIGVSLTAWGITYSQMKEAVETQVENLIVTIAGDLQEKLYNELDVATKINTMHGLMNNIHLATTNDSMDAVFLFLQAQWLLHKPQTGDSIEAIYYANKYGYMHSMSDNGQFATWPKGKFSGPSNWVCQLDGAGAATHDNCDITNVSTATVIGSLKMTSVGYYPPVMTLGVYTKFSFDPRVRPWYQYTTQSTWSVPYIFVGDNIVGVTATMGTKDTNGDWDGVLAVDLSLRTLSRFILPLLPTKNTVILVYTTDGVLISGSLNATTQMTNQTDAMATMNVWASSDPTISRIVSVVNSNIGTKAPTHTMVFHNGRHVVLAAPLTASGGLDLVIVVDIPYGDVLGQAEDASTTSLLLVFLLSLGCMALVAGGVTVALRPLRVLASNMQLAAWMKVEGLQKVDSRIIELRSMITSFETMVANLVEYKKYLPDALLAVQSETEEEVAGESHGDTGSRVSTNKTSLRSYDRSSVTMGTARAAAAVHQVFGSDMVQRHISVAVLRLHGMRSLLGGGDGYAGFQAVYCDFLECVQQQAKEHKGVMDAIFGDRVTLTFNAASSNSGHRHKLCAALLRITKLWREERQSSHEQTAVLSAGAATGSTVCGNCGSKALKRFGVFGRCVGVARALEVHCGEQASIYISEQLTQSVEGRHDVLKLRQVTFTSIGTPQIIAQLIRAKDTTHQGEWMYALQDSENTGYAAYNSALCLMLEGKYAEAEEKLKRSPLEGLNQGLRVRIRACVAGRVEEPVVLFADDF